MPTLTLRLKKFQPKTKTVKLISFLAKALILVASLGYIYQIFANQSESWHLVSDSLKAWTSGQGLLWALLVFLLMGLNWSLEALKWQFLSRQLYKMRFSEALKCILSGVTMSALSGNMAGHHFGRIWQMRHQDRQKMWAATLLGSYTQLYFTSVFGFFALCFFLLKIAWLSETLFYWGVFIVAFGSVLGVFFLFFIGKVSHFFLAKFPKIHYYFEHLSTYNKAQLGFVWLIALLRYLVFGLQYGLVLYFMGAGADMHTLFIGISLVFLVRSVVPNFNFLSNLGVREATAMYFFGQYGLSEPIIFVSTFGLWCINLCIPSVVGLLFIQKMQIFRK